MSDIFMLSKKQFNRIKPYFPLLHGFAELAEFHSLEQLEAELHDYIHYYNHERISLKLKGLSPVQYRAQAMIPSTVS